MVGRPLRSSHPEPRCDCRARMSHLGMGRRAFWAEVQQVQEPCSRCTLGMWRAERTQVSRSSMRERGDGGPEVTGVRRSQVMKGVTSSLELI